MPLSRLYLPRTLLLIRFQLLTFLITLQSDRVEVREFDCGDGFPVIQVWSILRARFPHLVNHFEYLPFNGRVEFVRWFTLRSPMYGLARLVRARMGARAHAGRPFTPAVATGVPIYILRQTASPALAGGVLPKV
jgi:hypothetical protein